MQGRGPTRNRGGQREWAKRSGGDSVGAMASAAAGASPMKTVMITGVSRGLGRALSLELARRGHTIIGCARSQEKLASLEAEVAAAAPPGIAPPKHLFTSVDVVRKSARPSLRHGFLYLGFVRSSPNLGVALLLATLCRGRTVACRSWRG